MLLLVHLQAERSVTRPMILFLLFFFFFAVYVLALFRHPLPFRAAFSVRDFLLTFATLGCVGGFFDYALMQLCFWKAFFTVENVYPSPRKNEGCHIFENTTTNKKSVGRHDRRARERNLVFLCEEGGRERKGDLSLRLPMALLQWRKDFTYPTIHAMAIFNSIHSNWCFAALVFF